MIQLKREPPFLFDVLLADPPWRYRNLKTGGTMRSGSAAKYDTLSMEQVAGMASEIQRITHPASVLFLWGTTPMKPEAMRLLEAWGFGYKTTVYWHKTGRLGLGYWFRGDVEELLVGARPGAKAFRCQRRNIIEAPSRGHSCKPTEAYELIEAATPGKIRAELFATSKRPGWSAWGDKVESDFDLDVPDDQ